MRAGVEPGDRFLRTANPQGTRRNYRRVQVQKMLLIAANAVLMLVIAAFALWLWQRTQSDARFAIREIETIGAKHTPRAALDATVSAYAGRNLFRLDIEEVRRELVQLPWVAAVAIEKELPDKLRVHVTEREPVALVATSAGLRYADAEGQVFAEHRPEYGNAGLPIITGVSDPADVSDCVHMLESLRTSSPELYGRVSEIAPEEGGTFRVFDRELKTRVLIAPRNAVEKWQALYGIVRAGGYEPGSIEYADLRFDHRVVIRPRVTRGHVTQQKTVASSGAGQAPGNA